MLCARGLSFLYRGATLGLSSGCGPSWHASGPERLPFAPALLGLVPMAGAGVPGDPRPTSTLFLNYLLRSIQQLISLNTCYLVSWGGRYSNTKPHKVLLSYRGGGGIALALSTLQPYLLLSLIVKLLERISLFSHRRILKRVFLLLSMYAPRLTIGLTILIAGKISVGGNSRSRKLVYRCGRYSGGQLLLRSLAYQNIVKTTTGCLGISVSLWF